MRGSRRSGPAAAALTLVLLVSACAQPVSAGPAALLRGCPQAHLTPPHPADALTGPAVDSLTGGAARSTFGLDDGALTIRPPEAGQRPTDMRDVAAGWVLHVTVR